MGRLASSSWKVRQHALNFALRWAPFVTALLATSCAPLSPAPPFHFTETAEVLKPKQVALTIAGGGGSADWGNGGGGGVRLRVGVGARQEVGVEGAVAMIDNGKEGDRPWSGASTVYGGKLSWKAGATSWLAFIVGAGGTQSATGTALGGDVAFVLSSPVALWGVVRPYGGARGGVGVPVGRDVHSAGGITPQLTAPGGLAFETGWGLRLFAEAGYLHFWSEPEHRAPTDPRFEGNGGWYAAVGFGFPLGASEPPRPAP